MKRGLKNFLQLILLAVLGLAAGCSNTAQLTGSAGGTLFDAPSAAPAPIATGYIPPDNSYETVTVFWGTNRRQAGTEPLPVTSSAPVTRITFGYERDDKLTVGSARITIPKDRQAGELPRPRSIKLWKWDVYSEKEDPRRHITLRELDVLKPDAFRTAVGAQGKAATSFKDHALVFVHGFNTSFEDALYRDAQITYDLGFDGPTFLFSWPSRGDPLQYLYDRDSVDYSIGPFLTFLDLVSRSSKAKHVHVIAHSMGARLVVDALLPAQERAGKPPIPHLGQVILAAADADRTVFEQRASRNRRIADLVTLYANSSDTALKTSKAFAGGVPRLGDVPVTGPAIIPGADTIDMSDATNWVFLSLHHNTYAERNHILGDIALLLRDGVRPPDRRSPTYRAVKSPHGAYWKYVLN
ncbi:MAG: alpha/beta hydrolase [Hyphomicrobiaceae bacterium]